MQEIKEKKYRRIGWITSVVVQLVMLLLFYFLIAWKEPFPPIPSYGIELSFGIEDNGAGELPVSATEPTDELEPLTEEATEQIEDPVEEEAAPQDEISEEAEAATEVPSEIPSPDVVKEERVEADESKEPVLPKEVKKEEKKDEPKPPVKEVKETLNPAASMPAASEEPNDSKGEQASEGIEGKKEGSIDGRALMGEQGAADGASLQMAGWVWDFKPDPKDPTAESGKIVYLIKVDADGYLTGIELVSSTVSPAVERYYRQSVERLSFTKTNDYSPAPTSSGRITFIIRSK